MLARKVTTPLTLLFLASAALLAQSASAPALPADAPDPGLKTIVQVAIVCKDIEACAHRWAQILGVEKPQVRITKPGLERKMTYRGKPTNDRAKLAFIRLGQTTLELLEPVGQNSFWYEVLAQQGEGVHHIAFRVTDPKKAVQWFTSHGIPVVQEGRYDSDTGGYIYLDARKQLGVAIELLYSDRPPPGAATQ